MNVYHVSYPLLEEKYQSSIIAIGFFDGVHLGHQQVISQACSLAKNQSLPCAVMTFNPHPKVVMGIIDKIDQITPIKSRLEQIEALNVDICYIVNFTKDFAKLTPKQFISEFLAKLQPRGIVVGFDFTFGYKGQGTAEDLYNLSKGQFTVDIIKPFHDNIGKISSTRVRDNLISGRISEISSLLGRNYSFFGKVVHGDKRGRTIGFPTANLELIDDYLTIKKGVYVVKLYFQDHKYFGVMNVGNKPTFTDEPALTYEIYIMDFKQDIYGETIQVELIDFIREEKKFHNIDDLKKQITADVEHARLTLEIKETI